MSELYRMIPQVAKILEDKDVLEWTSLFYLSEVKEEIDLVIAQIRREIKENKIESLSYEEVINRITDSLRNRPVYSLRRVINATGTLLHTNLGRAVYSKEMVQNIQNVLVGYNNLEYDLETGKRGSRYAHIDKKMANLIGAEDCLIVNNNAAAVMLTMQAFAFKKEVIVSRGELVEIGGSFRIPDIIEASGAIMKEVGTTNRTHLKDYQKAMNANTGLILKVHPSNFKVEGFTKEATAEELAELDTLLIEDLGSGLLESLDSYGLYERTVQKALKSVDLVTFSGDKLLGGPQVGVIAGKKEYIETLRKHQMTRALRVDKMTIAALEALIRMYLGKVETPFKKMLSASLVELAQKAEQLKSEVAKYNLEVVDTITTVGGGSLPTSKINSIGVTIEGNANKLEEKLRKNHIPIIGRIQDNKFILDMRTLINDDLEVIKDCLNE